VASDRCELLCLDLPRAESIRAQQPPGRALALAARRAGALSDPTRLRVAAALGKTEELCGCDLAWVLGEAQNLISHHLRALRDAGLADSRREGKTIMYSLTEDGRHLLAATLVQVEARV